MKSKPNYLLKYNVVPGILMPAIYSSACLLIFTIMSTSVFAQEGTLLGLSYKMESIETSDNIELAKDSYQSICLSYGFVPVRYFSFGLEVHKSIDPDVNFFDGRIKLGVTLNNKRRVQFPIYPFLGIYSLKQKDVPKYGNLLYGIHGGIRIYVTDIIALQGLYSITKYGITMEDGDRISEPYPTIDANAFSGGIIFYLRK